MDDRAGWMVDTSSSSRPRRSGDISGRRMISGVIGMIGGIQCLDTGAEGRYGGDSDED